MYSVSVCLDWCLWYLPRPPGKSSLGPDGWLEAKVKGITLGCRTQEVLGAEQDHLAGGGRTPPPPLPGRRTYRAQLSRRVH